MDRFERIIGFVQIDGFECQLWERKYPLLEGYPFLVSDNISGKILAVSPEAEKYGVTTFHTLGEAEMMCPSINVIFKPEGNIEEKKLIWEAREAINKFCEIRKIPFQHFSCGQWYLDLTENIRHQMMQNRVGQKSRDPFPFYFNESVNIYWEHEKQYQLNAINDRLKYVSQDLVKEHPVELANPFSQKFKLRTVKINISPYWDNISERDYYFLEIFFGANILHGIMNELETSVRVKCSAGVGSNMLQAHLGCNFHSHQGKSLTVLTNLGLRRISSRISVFSLPGIGEQQKLELEELFAKDLYTLSLAPLSSLKANFPHDVALKMYRSSRGICNDMVNTHPFLEEITCANYKLCVTTNKELRTQLELLLQPMLWKLREEFVNHKRDTKKLKITFSCCDVSGRENSVASVEIDYNGEQKQHILHIAQRCYRKVCKRRGFDSKFRTITSLEITNSKFFTILNCNGAQQTNNYNCKGKNPNISQVGNPNSARESSDDMVWKPQ